MFSSWGGHCCGKSIFFFNAFTWTSGQKVVLDANRLVSKWNTRTGKKKRVWRLKKKKKCNWENITFEEPAVTELVMTSIMLFPVLKCYSLCKCVSKWSTIRCTQTESFINARQWTPIHFMWQAEKFKKRKKIWTNKNSWAEMTLIFLNHKCFLILKSE